MHTHLACNPAPPDRLLAEKQQEVPAAIDPRRAGQFVHERDHKAGR